MTVASHLRALLPSRKDYTVLRRSWRGDLLAGVTVGVVALPLALGFGISSGAGAEAGLMTAIVAGFIAAVFGGSNVQVSGPTGAMVVVLAPIVASHGVAAVAVVSLLAGAIVLIAGVLRLGRAVSFIPWPVIEGFTVGIAIIIFLQQVPALGHSEQAPSHANVVVTAIESLATADPLLLGWSLGAVAVVAAAMIGLPLIHRAIPGSLVGIVVVALLAAWLGSPLATIGELPHALPAPSLPAFDPAQLSGLLLPALAVAALAAIESLLSARVAESMGDTGRFEPDRELVGQGLASIAAGFFGGMPATGAIARTAVNVRAGARTRVSAITHALILAVIVYAVAGPVGQIPLAALAGVLMVTAVRMVHLATVRSILRSTRADALAFVITAVITVSVDLIVAVGIGIVVAGVFAIRGLSKATTVTRQHLPGEAQLGDDRIALVRIDGPLFFAAADRVFDAVTEVESTEPAPATEAIVTIPTAEGAGDIDDRVGRIDRLAALPPVVVVILRVSRLEHLDASGAHALGEIVHRLEARGVTVLIKGIRPSHVALLDRLGVVTALRHPNHLFTELPAAIEHARSHVLRAADQSSAP